MKVTHYLYNSFIIEWGDKKIAIDPGGLFFHYFRFTTLIPKAEWSDITHIFVTHGDPDHFWHADRVAKTSGAPVIFNKTMVKKENGKSYMLGPRSKGLAFDCLISRYHTLSVDEKIMVDGMSVTGIKTSHGPLRIKLGPINKTDHPGPGRRIGWGSIGFEIKYKGKTIVNLGDTLLLAREWEKMAGTDVLMIPIGGGKADNTMDEFEAIEAVKVIKPKLVIPMHYNLPFLFSKHYNTADDSMFKEEVEKMGSVCEILGKGDHITI